MQGIDIVWLPGALFLIAQGLYAFAAKKPVIPQRSGMRAEEIEDVRGYNAAMGGWCVASGVVLAALGLVLTRALDAPRVWFAGLIGIALWLAANAYVYDRVILRRYRAKREAKKD